MDGIQLSNITLSDLDLRYGKEITFTIGVSEQAKHCGGVSIFGRGFGNYNQDIQAVLSFS
jgi:predicted transcriptional regulator